MNFNSFFIHTKSLIKLAYPILIAQLIQNLMGFVDIVMAGRVSAIDMAAVAVANSIWLPIILFTLRGKNKHAKNCYDIVFVDDDCWTFWLHW